MEITEKFIQLQSRVRVAKDNFNSFGRYSYRSCEDILAEAKPIANELGLYLVLSDDVHLIGERFYIKATAKVSDGKNEISNHAFAREATDKKGMDEAQITGSASSYARKYALAGLLGLDDEKDPDVPTNPQQHRGNEIQKKNQVVAENMGMKDQREKLIEEVKQKLGKFTEGFDAKAKAGAMLALTGMSNFNEIQKKTIEEMQKMIATINEKSLANNKPTFKLN